jgi:16S rRNA (cytosine1402-N4)-methyltransferase
MNYFHETVLKEEAIEYLVNNPDGIYLDATCGGGGHSLTLLEKHPNITLISSDWDMNAIKATEARLFEFKDRFISCYGDFSRLREIIKSSGKEKVSGVLADFGTSRHQINEEAGFSFKKDSFLDMRMSKGYTKVIAADIIREASEKELAHIFYTFGEEQASRKIAKAIVEERKLEPIRTTLRLAKIVEDTIGKKSKIHPATRVFQSLRIAVNKELEQIQAFLKIIPDVLDKNGRLVCISFHSLEDRLVKEFFRNNKEKFEKIGPKFIVPKIDEIKNNPASRSAKMRVYEKITD